MSKKIIFSILILFPLLFFVHGFFVHAQDCGTDIDCKISQLKKEYDTLFPAQQKNEQDLSNLKKQVASLTNEINSLSDQLKTTQDNIDKREADLAYTKEIFNQKTADQYRQIRFYNPIAPFLFSSSASEVFQEIIFRQKVADADRRTMEDYANELSSLESDKTSLEKNKENLAYLQKQVNDKAIFLQGEVDKVGAYLSSLTAQQQALEALKAGGFQTSIGDTPPTFEPCTGAPGSSNFCDPGFRPAFAAFSFGAPHRKGMSQYGAYGRAKSGQSAEDILHAYYGEIEIRKDYPTNINITVSGYGTVDLETYVKRIYEMPASWTDNDSAALKAQAVAARSYALAYTGNGASPICATESCQVYKPENKGGAWDTAVDATRGWVLVTGGQPFSAWYASTAGGYTFGYTSGGYSTPGEWDADGGKGGWPNNAYDTKGGSPWFYKAWFRSRSGDSCGKGSPWLNSSEMADIINAWKILYNGGGDVSRISPIGSCWDGNPYSISDLASIGGYSGVNSVSPAIYGNDGSTISITFQTDKGTVTIPGDQLEKAINLRAPGYIGLKSSLFNVVGL